MKRIKNIFVRVHIILWILFSWMIALQLSQSNANWPLLTSGLLFTSLYVFYGHFFLLTRYSGRKKETVYYINLTAIILSGPLTYFSLYYRSPDNPNSFLEQYFIYEMTIVLPFLFLSWLARVTENLVINTVKKEQLEKQVIESELYYLKSQINPHFLFNTLNNIHTLVYKQAPTAPEAVMQLASLMRYMIYESNATTVPLTKEIEYLQDYVSLQQLRYKQSPVVDLTIEGETASCHIAPLLFIHLLENAYKHSPARLVPCDLKVRVEVNDDTLTFSISNPIGKNRSHTLDGQGGIGLPNVRKRLALLYPGQHTVNIHQTAETFTVVLHIHGLQLRSHERKTNLLYH
ncbi:MAG: histidine kinase [Flaviaesturariibacter sp.]|nr:histidine kinase [Flaviaesturariibacter sp.]